MKKIFFVFLVVVTFHFFPIDAHGQNVSLRFSPSGGSFFVGSTFSVSVILDTKKNEINVIDIGLKFPPDILQVTSPTAGSSFIQEWLVPPNYSNIGGVVFFKGGNPEGIIVSSGVVSTITFRVKSSGKAKLEFLDSSRAILKDGQGTIIVTDNFTAEYEFLVPLPEGPKIESSTHPDGSFWYMNRNPVFHWEKKQESEEFSYSLSQNPLETPDAVSKGKENFQAFEDLPDGIWYFHLRAKRSGIWGKTSHFLVKIDSSPPQDFRIDIDKKTGFIGFEAKDFYSGISHYEIGFFRLEKSADTPVFFIDAGSPLKIPFLEGGRYKIIVRAYDFAGNLAEAEKTFNSKESFFYFNEKNKLIVGGAEVEPAIIYFFCALIIGVIVYLVFLAFRKKGYKKGIKEINEALEQIQKIKEKERSVDELKKKFLQEKSRLEQELSG